eukprot:TRINITY_DN5080_c0_g1_i11.p1 TRINITY_DN5080_c0_g1~~TRINITY_DN5080_c0_g1_i11.p1  ORF type:complete len:254 (-),score=30.60 TRINITY_DN5080_c0_g1_i11:262-1023(-)
MELSTLVAVYLMSYKTRSTLILIPFWIMMTMMTRDFPLLLPWKSVQPYVSFLFAFSNYYLASNALVFFGPYSAFGEFESSWILEPRLLGFFFALVGLCYTLADKLSCSIIDLIYCITITCFLHFLYSYFAGNSLVFYLVFYAAYIMFFFQSPPSPLTLTLLSSLPSSSPSTSPLTLTPPILLPFKKIQITALLELMYLQVLLNFVRIPQFTQFILIYLFCIVVTITVVLSDQYFSLLHVFFFPFLFLFLLRLT